MKEEINKENGGFLASMALIALVASLSAACGDEPSQKVAQTANLNGLKNATKVVGNQTAMANSCVVME